MQQDPPSLPVTRECRRARAATCIGSGEASSMAIELN
jgi:hypothetical protein